MSIFKSLFQSGAKPAPQVDPTPAEPQEKVADSTPVEPPAAKPTPAEVLADDAGALPKTKGGLHAQTQAEQVGRRGNFAAILSAHKAGEAPKESAASVGALTRGRAFAPRRAQTVAKVMGHPVTREGLEKLYGTVLPDANVFVTGVSEDRRSGALEFTVNWMDNDGELVAKLNRRMAKHEDGDLELYSHGCWVEPSHRSRAVSAAVMQREIEMLDNLSDHPRTRLSLWAGGMKDPNNPRDFQPLGVYVWATMGFDCAQTHGNRSRLSRSGGKARCEHEMQVKGLREKPDFELMKLMFDVWVDNAAERGQLPNDPAVLADLKRAADMCPNMWSLATLEVPGLKVDVDLGGKRSSCHVGKGFLLSEEAPRWEGVFYVNQQRDTFRQVADGYCGPRVEKAVAAFEGLQGQLAEALDGDDLDAKRDALAQVGRSGDARWVPALQTAIEQHPELADAAQDALRRVNGEHLTDALAKQAQDSGRIIKHRLSSLDLCLERDPGRRQGLLTSLVEAPQTGSDFEIARAALNRLARGKHDPDALLGLLDKLYSDGLNAREKLDPVDQGGRARGKSFFGQKVETRQAVIGHLARHPSPEAAGKLLEITKGDPYWEVGAAALDAWVDRVGGGAEPALDQVQTFYDRALGRYGELRDEKENADKDRAWKIDDLMRRVSRVRVGVIETMSRLEGPEVATALERAIDKEPNWDGAWTALEGLAKVIGGEDPGRVAKQAEHWYDQAGRYAPMRARCVGVLAGLQTPDARRTMVKMAQREQSRDVLVELLGGLEGARVEGAADARETVRRRIDTLDEQARREAAARRREMEARRAR